MFFLGFISG